MKPIHRVRRSPDPVRCSACHRIGRHAAVAGIIPGEMLYVCAWCVSALQHLYTDPEGAEAHHQTRNIMALPDEFTQFATAVKRNKRTDLLETALRALCLTRDYVGEQVLPAIPGWEWYDAAKAIADAMPDNRWAKEFYERVEGDHVSKQHLYTDPEETEAEIDCTPNLRPGTPYVLRRDVMAVLDEARRHYPEDVFPDLTDEPASRDRIAGASCRHLIDVLKGLMP